MSYSIILAVDATSGTQIGTATLTRTATVPADLPDVPQPAPVGAAVDGAPTIVRMSTVNDASRSVAGADKSCQHFATTLSVFWPEAEHGKLVGRWPRPAAEVEAIWHEHRQQVSDADVGVRMRGGGR